jgi:hypothetical protein
MRVIDTKSLSTAFEYGAGSTIPVVADKLQILPLLCGGPFANHDNGAQTSLAVTIIPGCASRSGSATHTP